MSNAILYASVPGLVLYGVIKSPTGMYYNTGTVAFEAGNLAHWANYAVALAAQTIPQDYAAPMPAGVTTAGRYRVVVYLQAGAAPDVTDPVLDEVDLDWNGSAEQTAANIAVSASGQVAVSNISPGSYVLKVIMAAGVPSISSVPMPTKIAVARGASLAISVPIFQADGVTPQDLTGWSAIFMVKADANDPDSTVPTVGKTLIYKDSKTIAGLTIPTPTNGILLFSIQPADTYEEEPFVLFPLGTWEFFWGLKLYNADGTLQPPGAGGAFVVQGFPVHRQTPPL